MKCIHKDGSKVRTPANLTLKLRLVLVLLRFFPAHLRMQMPWWIRTARCTHTNIHVCNFPFLILSFIQHNTTDTNQCPPTQRQAHPNTPLKLTRLVWAALVGYWPRLNQAEPASGEQTGRQSGSVRGWCNVKAEERERGLRGLKQSLVLSFSFSYWLSVWCLPIPLILFLYLLLSVSLTQFYW